MLFCPRSSETAPPNEAYKWLLTCTDYFGRTSGQWEQEAQRIRNTISLMEAKVVAPFALTYWRQMTRELGYTKHAGYEFWHVFAEHAW